MTIKVLGDFTTMIDINVARTGKYVHNADTAHNHVTTSTGVLRMYKL